jgi:ABC-2 type transport system ATP-binding protein
VLLLLDEPTTGLDPRSKLEVQALVTDMQSQHDATVLLCTHDLAEAEELAGRVGILHRGELIALEAAADLKLRYGAATLEEAFFSATGDRLEDDPDRSTDEGGDSP